MSAGGEERLSDHEADEPKRLMPKPARTFTHCDRCGDWLAGDRVKIGICFPCNVRAVFGEEPT
jgi:uncharacterized protein YlaI